MATTTPQTTYFGDVNVYGNTTMSGTLAVLGTPALFSSNLGVVTDRTSLIGTQATPFQYAWMTAANTTSVNFLTNIPGPIGVGTAATGTQVTVQGNVQVSNSVSTTNVNVVTSINTGSIMNVNFLTGPGGVGIGTNVVGTAALAVLGTMNAVTSLQAANLVLSGTLNVGAANIFSIVTSNVGIGTTPVTGGAALAIQGFASVSNAISTTNVYVTTANVGTLNTGALVNSTGFLGFGTAAASGTTAYVLGDLGSSNAINAPVMTSNGLIATGRINVATLVVQSNVGVGIAPVQGGATLAVQGNVFLSNAFTTPQVFAGSMNVSSLSNIVTGLARSNVLIGPGADLYKGFNLAVGGNVVISNALQTTGVTSNLINVGTSANLLALMNAFAIGTTTLFPNASMTINGNLYASNTATISTANTTLSNVTQNANAVTITATSNVGIGTTPVAGGHSLTVQGNLFASNALTTTNVFATTSANTTTLNTGSIFTTSSGFLGISTTNPSGTTLYVPGNVYTSNTLTTGLIYTTNSNTAVTNATTIYVSSSVGIGTTPVAGGANLAVQGNAFISNSVTTTNIFATTSANAGTLNTGSIFTTSTGFLGIGTSAPSGTSLYLSGNVYASNALVATNIQATLMNVTGLANTTNFTMGTGQFLGIGTTPTGNALEVSGNAFVSNSISSTNVFSTLANVGTLNTLSIFTRNSFLGVGTSAASGTSLFVPGNVYASTSISAPALFYSNITTQIVSGNATTVTTGTGLIGPLSPAGVWAYLPFNGTLADAAGGGNLTGPTPTGTLTYAASGGPGGNPSLQLATGSWIDYTASSTAINVDVTGATMSFWFKADTTIQNATQGLIYFQATNTTYGLFVDLRPAISSVYFSTSGGVVTSYVATTWVVGQWYHISCVLDPINKVVLMYRNGVLGGTGMSPTWSGTAGYLKTFLRVGAWTSPPTYAVLQPTSFADVRVYNAALTAPQIAVIYAQNGLVPSSGQTLYVTGNLYASNAVTTTNVTATSANVTGVSNVTTLAQIPSISLGTSAGGAALNVRGNVVASNSVTTTNVYAIRVNTATANTLSIAAPVGVGATGYAGVWAYLPFNGTLADAAGGGNLTAPVGTGTLTYVPNDGPGTGPTLHMTSGSYATWTIQTNALPVDNGVSVSLWFRYDETIGSGANGYFGMTTTAGSINNFGCFISGPAIVYRYYSTTGTDFAIYTYNTGGLTVGTWYNLAVTVNGATKTLTAYFNGTVQGTATYTNAGGYITAPTMILGGYTTGGVNKIQQATSFADVRVYNAALTAPQIAAIYAQNAAAPPTGYALQIQGNLYASNALTIVGNIAATSMNLTSTLNTGSVTTAVLIANAIGWSNTNIFISNSITTTNVFTTNVNAASYVGTSGTIGIGTAGSGYALQIQGNLASSNALWSLPDVSAPTSIYYVDDITKRSPHLLPTQSNAALIQCWISATCNAASPPTAAWWATSPTPVFGNVAPGPLGLADYNGSVLLPDGRVLFVPYSAPNIGVFNPTTGLFSALTPTGLPQINYKFSGGVLTPNGNVVFVPSYNANIGIFNPMTSIYSNGPTVSAPGLNSFIGGVLAPNGNVIFSPYASANVGVYNPVNMAYSNIAAPSVTGSTGSVLLPNGNVLFVPSGSGTVGVFNPATLGFTTSGSVQIGAGSFMGGVLVPNGNVVFIPSYSGSNVGIFNPASAIYANAAPHNCGASPFWGGCLAPSGKVIMAPYNSSNVGMFDPVSLVYTNCAAVSTGGAKFRGCALLTSGQVVFAPSTSASVGILNMEIPAPQEFCLSPYFNKF